MKQSARRPALIPDLMPLEPALPRLKPSEINHAAARCVKQFSDRHLARHGVRAIISGGKHAALFKKLVQTYGEDEVISLMETFFRTTDPRVVRYDWTVETFYRVAPYLMTHRHNPVRDDRTLHNLDVMSRVTGEDTEGA